MVILLNIAVIICLFAIAWIDKKTMEIPDSLNIAIAVCGFIAIFISPDISLKSQLLGIAVAAPLLIISIFVEGAFGFGDVKLMAAAGFFLGWQRCLVALVIGIIAGGIYAVFTLVTKKKSSKDHFAFGPALCAGIGVSIFAGKGLFDLYFGIF